MNRDEIADALDEAATWDECASYPASSRAALESRDADARRESAATYPGGRGLGANLAADEPSVPKWAKAMFDAQADMIAEQAERIDAQADIIDQLHVANKHLAGRIDKASGIADRNAVSTSKFLGNFQTRINRLEHWRARAIEAVPQLGKQSTEEDQD